MSIPSVPAQASVLNQRNFNLNFIESAWGDNYLQHVSELYILSRLKGRDLGDYDEDEENLLPRDF